MVDVTVIIPTLNGATYLREVLQAVAGQEGAGDVEVIVIDSGSTDGTLDIVADFPEVHLEHIAKKDFGHGRTRNWGAELARGRYVAFLTQDATPASPHWLRHLIEPLHVNDDVWGVYGLQIPRSHCPPMLKYEIRNTFAASGADVGVTLQSAAWTTAGQRDRAGFYSDVNSATRKDVLTTLLAYRDVRYGEDQLFGRDVLDAGKLKAYSPAAAVIHSNDVKISDYANRVFDEALALREIGAPVAVGGPAKRYYRVARGVVGDTLRIARDADYRWSQKLRWWSTNPRYHLAKWRGYRWGEVVDPADDAQRARYSLEAGGS